MLATRQYACILYCVSSGLNGECLGSDEQELVSICSLVVDVHARTTIDASEYLIQPQQAQFVGGKIASAAATQLAAGDATGSANVNFLSDECRELTGLTDAGLQSSAAVPLHVAIEKLDQRLREVRARSPPQACGSLPTAAELVLVTDGPLHLRQALIPECLRKNITLPFYYYAYVDASKQFAEALPGDDGQLVHSHHINYNALQQHVDGSISSVLDSIDNVASSVSTNREQQPEQVHTHNESLLASYALRQCREIEKRLLAHLAAEHGPLRATEIIHRELEQCLCSAEENIDENTIVRVRGLPWQCTEQDVGAFFAGLNIAEGGVALCLSSQGRRNGEALVRFANEQHRNLALRRHKHHIGLRYIEVYRASGKDFLNVAGGSNNEAKTFLSRNGKIIIRMRGLPFDAVAKDVVEFFERGDNSCQIVDAESGVLFVHYPDGRATGDAFVMLRDEDDTVKVLQKHKETMGARYIELFRSTSAEVQQVFKRSQDPKYYQHNISTIGGGGAGGSYKDYVVTPLPILPPELISGGNRKDCIRMRNLPLECGVEQILEFLGIHSQHIVQQGVHMILNAQGHASGEAFIQFDGEHSSLNVSNYKNGKCMYFNGKKFFVEVLQCSGEEMNLVLMGLLPSNLINFNGSVSTVFQMPRQHMQNSCKTNTSPLSMSSNVAAANSYYLLNGSPNNSFVNGGVGSVNSYINASGCYGSMSSGVSGCLVGGGQFAFPPAFGQMPMSSSMSSSAASSSSLFYAPVCGGAGSTSCQTATGPRTGAGGPQPSLSSMRTAGSNGGGSGHILAAAAGTFMPGAGGHFAAPPVPQPLIYWYPTPPVSPSPAYFLTSQMMHQIAAPSILILKGAPAGITIADVLQFFSGYEILPDCVQIQNNGDMYSSGGRMNAVDVLVTFYNRNEAERAYVEKNHHKIGNHLIELYLTI